MLEAVNLSCARGDRTLFRGLSLRLCHGELLHVTGPNGAGKTTLLRALCGLTRPAEGEIRWHGNNIRALGDEYLAQLAYVGHLNGIQGELSPVENLWAATEVSDIPDPERIDTALAQLALAAHNDFPARILSQGQKRRLALARLLVLDRSLWILDEPLAALDTHSIDIIIGIISGHLARGGMAVLTSHQPLDLPTGVHRTLNLEH